MKLSESDNCPNCNFVLPLRFTTGRVVCRKCGWNDRPKSISVSNETKEQGSNSEAISASMRSTSSNQASIITGVQSVKNPKYGFGWFLLVVGSAMMGIRLIYDLTISSDDYGRT